MGVISMVSSVEDIFFFPVNLAKPRLHSDLYICQMDIKRMGLQPI